MFHPRELPIKTFLAIAMLFIMFGHAMAKEPSYDFVAYVDDAGFVDRYVLDYGLTEDDCRDRTSLKRVAYEVEPGHYESNQVTSLGCEASID